MKNPVIIVYMQKGGSIYIMINQRNTTLYVGVTSDLAVRISKHLNKEYINSFTKKYNLDKLVYFEDYDSIKDAIAREKVIKGWTRDKKIALIKSMNPEFKDLYDIIIK